MRPVSRFILVVASCQLWLLKPTAFADRESDSGAAVIREMNRARENPALYATYVAELRSHLIDGYLVMPGHARIRTKEGSAAFDEAIRFLRGAQPIAPLTFSPGMSRASADHCAEQVNGGTGHGGCGASNPGSRISRYGTWSAAWGENISYGRANAREVVIALIVDDGLPARKHRKNIFNPAYNFAGAAFGPHAKFRSVCSMDFAGGFVERGGASVETLVAGN